MIYKKKMYQKNAYNRRNHPAQQCRNTGCDAPYTVTLSPKTPSLAAVYGIKQEWRGIDDSCVGFSRGTIFNELDKPFKGYKCKNGGYCK